MAGYFRKSGRYRLTSSGGLAFPQFHTLNDAHGQIVTNGALYFPAQPDIATALSASRSDFEGTLATTANHKFAQLLKYPY